MGAETLPARIGQYVPERVVGAGAMGQVLAARHAVTHEPVAVKLLKAELAELGQFHDRFLREARVLTTLEHPNVVRALDSGVLDDGAPYFVMELLQGYTLRTRLKEHGALPLETTVDYVIQACAGLSVAHEHGIVHRDVKPSNLFLASDGRESRIKILDFGISKLPKESETDLSLTDTSMLLGSPSYMSPEQVRLSKNVDARADIWSLGIVLYQLLSARLPFTGDGFSAMCAAIIADAPAPLPPDVKAPASFQKIILRCLEKSPEWRYANVAELAVALAPFASPAGRAVALALGGSPSAEGSVQADTVPEAFAPQPTVDVPEAPVSALTMHGIVKHTPSRTSSSSVIEVHVDAPPRQRPRLVYGAVVAIALAIVAGTSFRVFGRRAFAAGGTGSEQATVVQAAPSAAPEATVTPPTPPRTAESSAVDKTTSDAAALPTSAAVPSTRSRPRTPPRPHASSGTRNPSWSSFGGSALDDHY